MKIHKYYFLYKTTNLIDGMFYIGQHQTDNLDDGYLGSGKRLLEAIDRFGKQNFRCDILEFFPSWELLNQAERSVVSKDFLKRKDVYNIREGGRGMDDRTCLLGGLAHKRKLLCDQEYRKEYVKRQSLATRKTMENPEIVKRRLDGIRKYRAANPQRVCGAATSTGAQNPNFGKCWICNETLGLSLHWDKADPIPPGWRRGLLFGRKTKGQYYTWIHRNGHEKRIDSRVLEIFKSVGWIEGRLWMEDNSMGVRRIDG